MRKLWRETYQSSKHQHQYQHQQHQHQEKDREARRREERQKLENCKKNMEDNLMRGQWGGKERMGKDLLVDRIFAYISSAKQSHNTRLGEFSSFWLIGLGL